MVVNVAVTARIAPPTSNSNRMVLRNLTAARPSPASKRGVKRHLLNAAKDNIQATNASLTISYRP